MIRLKSYSNKDIKKAIDNYAWILEKSPWYGKNLYSFPRFFANQKLFEDCITENVKDNNRYFRRKLTKEELLDEIIKMYRRVHAREPMTEEIMVYRNRIEDGEIENEDDIRLCVGW